MAEINVDALTPDQKQKLVFIFVYESMGPFVLAREGPDEAPIAVYGDWNGDGNGYWETCAHCFLPLMERAGYKL